MSHFADAHLGEEEYDEIVRQPSQKSDIVRRTMARPRYERRKKTKLNTLTLGRAPLAFLGVALVLTLALQASVPANAQGQTNLAGKWDRLNPDQGNPTPEHEVLRCGGNARPTCVHDRQPEPRLGFENPPDSTYGHFRGEDITEDWICPGWAHSCHR
jgi:hypothetical protein